MSASADLLTLAEVSDLLGLTVRQLGRLRRGPDPLPVIHLTRKEPRIRHGDLDAWLARRPLVAASYSVYRGPDDGQRTPTDSDATRTDASGDGRAPRRERQHGGPVGAGRGADHRAGRPLDSVRRGLRC